MNADKTSETRGPRLKHISGVWHLAAGGCFYSGMLWMKYVADSSTLGGPNRPSHLL
jgi:hypothetical protein